MSVSLSGGPRTRPQYPQAERLPVTDVRHGREVADPYRWLEDPACPQTRAWAAAQQALADTYACSGVTRDLLAGRLAAFAGVGALTPPVWLGGRQIVTRQDPDQELPVVYAIEPDGAERALLDLLALDPSGRTTLGNWRASRSGRWIAYQVSHRGTEHSVLYVLDTESGEIVDGPIDRLRSAWVTWAPDSSGFWYVRRLVDSRDGTTVAPRRVFWHQLGADAAGDSLVFGEGAEDTAGFWPRVLANRYLTMRVTLGTSAENTLWLADVGTGDPAGPVFHPVVPELRAAVTPAIGRVEQIYLTTTLDAPRGRICGVSLADLDRLGPDYWHELVPEDSDPDSVLLGALPLAGGQWGPERLFVMRSRSAVAEVAIHDAGTGERLRDVPLPGAGLVTNPSPHTDGGNSIWFRYTDLRTPSVVLRYDLTDHRVSVHARPPGKIPDRPVACHRVRYRSADGTAVQMFLISPASCAAGPDRPRPVLLTGYGGFGVSMMPRYRAEAMAWAEAGGVMAIACVRGGGEGGDQWHRAATGTGKQLAIDDFNAAAEWLIDTGWTTARQLAAFGTSNGGLLVTAAMTQRPELYRAVAATAPLTDMVRYELSGLGPLWRSEYGTVDDSEQFEALLRYSPYHRVRPDVAYPAVLLTVPETDTRVDPSHSRKLCAALQDASSGAGPVLLRLVRDAGHGARSRTSTLATAAETLAFLAEQTGLYPAAPAA
jgi:prolyl oligopeptidase